MDNHKILWTSFVGHVERFSPPAVPRHAPNGFRRGSPALDGIAAHAYMGGMNIGTRLFTWLHGRQIGSDAEGNIYYEDKRGRTGLRTRRWVAYAGAPEASSVPPEWHAWLHYTTDAPLPAVQRAWIKPHQANMTGTPASYRPPGHDYEGGKRAAASADYEAWTPGA